MTVTKILSPSFFLHKFWARHIALGTGLVLGGLCSLVPMAQANDTNQQVRQGLPGRRISGASRLPTSTCARHAGPLVAIVPENNLGATATAEPTLWVSVPDVVSAKQLEFSLFNNKDEVIYQTSFTVDSNTDLVGLDLGSMVNAPNLEVAQRYRWAASIVCNPNNRSENISVQGWVDRVEGQSLDDSGLWYDRLGSLVEELQHSPNSQDALNRWHLLMASAKLEKIVPLPIEVNAIEANPIEEASALLSTVLESE